MHKIVVPKYSSAHRFATKALYRALLRQCAKLPDAPTELNACKSHIQHRFKRYKGLQSPSQTANSLKAGYEALDLLYSASQGNKDGIHRIQTIICEHRLAKQQKAEWLKALAEARGFKIPSKKEVKKLENKRYRDMTVRRHPDAESVLSRPRQVVVGKRRIPKLVNARGFPFLLYKKPQPKFLSAVLNSKLNRRWKRMERLKRLELELPFAKDEDAWDALTGHEEEVTWAEAVKVSLKEVREKIAEGDRKTKELAEAMWNVVLEERKLAEKEEKERAELMKKAESGEVYDFLIL
ncbi:LYR motif-containing protein [Aspergillus ibericus CBS 121593]|uniref:Complex 1 LYR protein domain-containing protein n=1 Tax=Aspergillus ibericus CBS 121593 TaxID=1448316 RepID=A0A395GZL3_9EURO|nr:hypothetical protein BO80DRAFT_381623 [Aspergillus ibericus CBS 121593]RAL00996.1 hypothetical protein BO80DRAFT_381623 [Aspergillus ibericus CBS 121593]